MTCTESAAISESMRFLTAIVMESVHVYHRGDVAEANPRVLEDVLEDETMLNQVREDGYVCVYVYMRVCLFRIPACVLQLAPCVSWAGWIHVSPSTE
jgi:hypothetical protein